MIARLISVLLLRDNRPETSGADCFTTEQNSGKGAARKNTFQQATEHILASRDADHQYHPNRAGLF